MMRHFVQLKFWFSRLSRPRSVAGLLILASLLVFLQWRIAFSPHSTVFNRQLSCSILDDEDCGVSSELRSVPEEDVVWCAEKGGHVITKDSVRELGKALKEKVYLTVGIPTVERKYQNKSKSYLTTTLNSLLTKLPPEEHRNVLFVVMLADTKKQARDKVKKTLQDTFGRYIEQNLIHVIAPPSSYYPQLHGLPRTFKDGEERMYWRSKQAMDYVFLMHYSEGLSQYYMQLEDDVLVESNYMDEIRIVIELNGDFNWPYLQFCAWGFIGKVFRSENLGRLGRLIRMFYHEMPCDWLLDVYKYLHNIPLELPKDSYPFKGKKLFIHIGDQSSSLGT